MNFWIFWLAFGYEIIFEIPIFDLLSLGIEESEKFKFAKTIFLIKPLFLPCPSVFGNKLAQKYAQNCGPVKHQVGHKRERLLKVKQWKKRPGKSQTNGQH